MNADPFTGVLNRFCAGLSEKLVVLAEEPDVELAGYIAGELLDAIRETMANLMLLEAECEWLLRRA